MNKDKLPAFLALLKMDLSKLPDEALKSISISILRERQSRIEDSIDVCLELKNFEKNNSKFFANRPKSHDKFNEKWLSYLTDLLMQDWSSLFSGDEKKKYYVYFHVTPGRKKISFANDSVPFELNGIPFYVGKGTGSRAFDLNRNQGHGAILKQLKSKNFLPDDIVYIIKDGLTESEALEIESKFIYFFGTKYEKGRKGILVNLDIPKKPDLQHQLKHSKINYKKGIL
jgi:hypothetical protein